MSDTTIEKAEKNSYIPMEKWGKDHWSTFAYLETRVVDHNGKIENVSMRCHPRLHRQLAGLTTFGKINGFDEVLSGTNYPTRLKEGEIENHDDWSCVEDMEAAGLLKFKVKEVNKKIFGNSQATVTFTELGYKMAGLLRQHKGEGKKFSNFNPEL